MVNQIWLFVVFAVSIIFIILATAKFRLHAFLVLILAAYFVGLFSKMPLPDIVSIIAKGFGNTIGYIGIVIAFGTIIGTFLEKSGGAFSMADALLRIVGKSKSPLAMAITGFIVSIPVFCDSGFVILSPLNKALSKESKITLATYAMALSLGLYATHTLVPPTPGPIAAAGLLSADLGTVILLGLIASIPATIVGYFFATKFASRFEIEPDIKETYEELKKKHKKLPSATMAFLPIVIPIVLIVFKAFGAILKATPITEFLKQHLVHYRMSIFLPFLIAAALKTAQGSSTVAIITTSAIIAPIMGSLGLASPIGRALAVIAVGAGSMVVSHANDSYFWVVSQFSNMDVATAYKTQTFGTFLEGLASFIAVAIMALILL